MKTREQAYALAVYDKVKEYVDKSDSDKSKYGSIAHKLPILIRQAGLCQALQFVDTRKDAQKEILKDLAEVMHMQPGYLMERSREAELDEYMLLTDHALAALLWFKRYAQSVLGVTADMDGDEGDHD